MRRFFIDIERELQIDTTDSKGNAEEGTGFHIHVDNFSIDAGSFFSDAVELFFKLCEVNLKNKPGANERTKIVYIKFRLGDKENNVILSRRSPSGVGDW